MYNAAWYAWKKGVASKAEQLAALSVHVRTEKLAHESKSAFNSVMILGYAFMAQWRIVCKKEKLNATIRRFDSVLTDTPIAEAKSRIESKVAQLNGYGWKIELIPGYEGLAVPKRYAGSIDDFKMLPDHLKVRYLAGKRGLIMVVRG
jgi:hypothetical protein